MRQLTLTIGSITTTLKKFTSYDRTPADTGQTEYSIAGTPLDSGPAYTPKLIWTVSAMVTLDQWRKLNAIFMECDRRRRLQQNYRITVEDSIQDYVEASVTRPVASGGIVTAFSGGVSYPAKFYARMHEPKSQWQGNGVYPYVINFVLRELDSP